MTDAPISPRRSGTRLRSRLRSRLNEWLWRSEALGRARAALAPSSEAVARATRQAVLLVEVARRVAEPAEALPPGSRADVMLGLHRDAVFWALAARRPDLSGELPPLAALWDEARSADLVAAAKTPAALATLRALLVDRARLAAGTATDDDAALARGFAEALVAGLEAPRRDVDRLLVQRWLRVGLVLAAVLALVYGIRTVALGPNLLAHKAFRTSSSWSGCAEGCEGIFFHTNPEMNPWLEYDLGAPTVFHRIEVTNRQDCCGERTVPLIVETSDDRAQWTELAHRETEFSEWTATFPPKKARYVRLRVPRNVAFHLHAVALR